MPGRVTAGLKKGSNLKPPRVLQNYAFCQNMMATDRSYWHIRIKSSKELFHNISMNLGLRLRLCFGLFLIRVRCLIKGEAVEVLIKVGDMNRVRIQVEISDALKEMKSVFRSSSCRDRWCAEDWGFVCCWRCHSGWDSNYMKRIGVVALMVGSVINVSMLVDTVRILDKVVADGFVNLNWRYKAFLLQYDDFLIFCNFIFIFPKLSSPQMILFPSCFLCLFFFRFK